MRAICLVLVLLTSGCSLDQSYDGVDLGASLSDVQRRYRDGLVPAGDANALSKKAGTKQVFVRYPDDARVVAVAYGFEADTLRTLIVGFAPEVDHAELARQIGVANGAPNDQLSIGGASTYVWERPGEELTLLRLPQAAEWPVESSAGEEEPERVAVGVMLWSKRRPEAALYPWLVVGALLTALGMLAVLVVATRRLEAGQAAMPWTKPVASALALATGGLCMAGYGLELFGCAELLSLGVLALGYPLDRKLTRLEQLR